MADNFFGIVDFSLLEYAISGNAILGIRDSGKTYAGCEAAEELEIAGVPSICLDPIGRWHSLRIPGTGRNARGFPFVVAGGAFADLPLTRQNCAAVVRSAMEAGISLVLDLFSRELTKSDWRYIVQQTMEILLFENEPHGMRHIFIEEAGEFVPQRVYDNNVFMAVEKVVRMGGNAKLGCTLIHQRPADINKSVLELCANVILLRQTGKNTLTDLRKWMDLIEPGQAKEIVSTLKDFRSGEGWAFLHSMPDPIRFKVPARRSKHPDRREQGAVAEAARKAAIPADRYIETMKAKLAAIEESRRAASSKKAAPSRPNGQPVPAAATVKPGQIITTAAAIQKQIDTAYRAGADAAFASVLEAATAVTTAWKAVGDPLADLGRILKTGKVENRPPQAVGSPPVGSGVPRTRTAAPQPLRAAAPRHATGNGETVLGQGEVKVLTAIAQTQNGATREMLTVLTGYKKTTRDVYVRRLAASGYCEVADRITATDAGVAALGPDFEPLPTGAALREHVLATLPEGERRILEAVIDVYDGPADRGALSDHTGYQKTTRDVYIRRLAARELVEVSRDGVKASASLF